jgi:hypothetical protein
MWPLAIIALIISHQVRPACVCVCVCVSVKFKVCEVQSTIEKSHTYHCSIINDRIV